jgi:transcriptional regulator with XRE-family HTH domain
MGLFNFSKYSEIERGLLETYSKIFSDMGLPNSEKMAKDILNQSIDESKKENCYNLPINLGDVLLQKEKDSGKENENFKKKRKEGVKDEDIKWWFNLNDIERRMMAKVDDMNCLAMFINEIENGKSENEAAAIVRKYHPKYGNPEDDSFTKGDDRPIPYELKDRVNIYIEKRFKNDQEKYKKDIESSSTFNALVRKEIKAGNI